MSFNYQLGAPVEQYQVIVCKGLDLWLGAAP